METDLNEVIADNLQKPAQAAGDAGSASQHPLPDQIEAARFLAGQKATRPGKKPLRLIKIIPPGAV